MHDTGNVMEDVRFVGGRYGIWTRTPSPGWQFTAIDVSFEGQREAAIRETAAGLTLIRPTFRNVPTAVTIDAGAHDELWVKDARLEDVSGPAVVDQPRDQPAHARSTWSTSSAGNVPDVRDGCATAAGRSRRRRPIYDVRTFSHGLHYADLDAPGVTESRFDAAPLSTLPAPVASDLVPLPPARHLGERADARREG